MRLKKRIITEYDDIELEVTYAEKFSSRRLSDGEDLSALMLDLKRLVIKGYPSFSVADRAKLVNNQFLKSLSSGARKHVLLNPVKEDGETTMAACDTLLAQARLIDQIERGPSQDSDKSACVAAIAPSKSEDQMGQMISAMTGLTKMVQEVLSSPSVARVQQSNMSNRPAAGSTRGSFRG